MLAWIHPGGEVRYPEGVPFSAFGKSVDEPSVDVDDAKVISMFCRASRILTAALMDWQSELGQAPVEVQTEVELEWAVFASQLTPLAALGTDLSQSDALKGATDFVPNILVLCGYAFVHEDLSTLLCLVDDAKVVRPDLKSKLDSAGEFLRARLA